MPQRKAYERSPGKANRDVYDSPKWKKIRAIVKDEEPVCRLCLAQQFVVDTEVIDHIIPINMGGDPYDRNNLQGLCRPCHEAKSRRESASARRTGKTP